MIPQVTTNETYRNLMFTEDRLKRREHNFIIYLKRLCRELEYYSKYLCISKHKCYFLTNGRTEKNNNSRVEQRKKKIKKI